MGAIRDEYSIWLHIEREIEYEDGDIHYEDGTLGIKLSGKYKNAGEAREAISNIEQITNPLNNFVVIHIEGGLVRDTESPPWIDTYITDYEDDDGYLRKTEDEIEERKQRASWWRMQE